jgi:hypothetical protein
MKIKSQHFTLPSFWSYLCLFPLFFILMNCAGLQSPEALSPEGQKIHLVRQLPPTCFETKKQELEVNDYSKNPYEGAINQLKNQSAKLKGSHVIIDQLYSRGDGSWVYAKALSVQCIPHQLKVEISQ